MSIGGCGQPEVYPGSRRRGSGTLLPESCRSSLRDQPWQPDEVVGRATANVQPVDLLQSSQFDLRSRPACLSHPKPFSINQRWLAYGIAELACGPSFQVEEIGEMLRIVYDGKGLQFARLSDSPRKF